MRIVLEYMNCSCHILAWYGKGIWQALDDQGPTNNRRCYVICYVIEATHMHRIGTGGRYDSFLRLYCRTRTPNIGFLSIYSVSSVMKL